MKIYFAGSIRGGRDDASLYGNIISVLQDLGHEVLTEHIGLASLDSDGEAKTEQFIYSRDMDWLRDADLVVAEVTNPSLGVGYELGKIEDMGTPCVCLFRPESGKSLSAMIVGNPNMRIVEYSADDDLENLLKNSI